MTRLHRCIVVVAVASLSLAVAAPTAAGKAKDRRHGDCNAASTGPIRSSVPIAAMPTSIVCAKPVSIIGDGIGLGGDALGSLLPGGGLAGGALGDAVGSAVGSVGTSVMDGITNWVAGGVAWVVDQVFVSVRQSTTPTVTAAWFKSEYGKMLALAGVLAVPMLLLAGFAGLFRADAASIARAALINLPLAFLVTGAALAIVQTLLVITDVTAGQMTAGFGGDMKQMFKSVLAFLKPAAGAGDPVTPTFITLIFALLALLGSLLVWIELIMREAALYIVVLFMPLGCVISIWPPAKRVAKKMAILLCVVIFSKFAILVIFAFGATVLAKGGSTDGVTGVLSGAAIMLLAAFSPMVLLKLLPFDEIDSVSRPTMSSAAQMHVGSMMRGAINRGGSSGGPPGPPQGAPGPGGASGPSPGGGRAGGGAGGGRSAGGPSVAGAPAAARPAGAAVGAGAAAAGMAKDQATTRTQGLSGTPNLATTDLAAAAGPGGASLTRPATRPPAPSGDSPLSANPPAQVAGEETSPPPHLAARRGATNLRELGSV